MSKEKTIHDVPIPVGVTDQMVKVAKYYVTNRLKDEFTIQAMCKELGFSSATWSKWKQDSNYMEYINQMCDVLIPSDELEAVRKFRKKVMAFADKDTLTAPEMKLFQDVFAPIIEADIKLQMDKLGLNKASSGGSTSPQSVEEKKAILLARLKG